MDCKTHVLSQHDEGTRSLTSWLTARAPALRQLAFCDECVYLGVTKGEQVTDLCPTDFSTGKPRLLRVTTSIVQLFCIPEPNNMYKPAPSNHDH